MSLSIQEKEEEKNNLLTEKAKIDKEAEETLKLREEATRLLIDLQSKIEKINNNIEAVKTLIRRAMDLGFYEGVNLSLSYCDDCGHQELEMDVCPKCGSSNLTKIDRMNGYLSYSRVHGDTRLNDAKMAEIAERKSM